jgi:hypothetical protein
MKHELDKILFFNDLLGELQALQDQTKQIQFDLYPLLFNPLIPQKHFVLPKISDHQHTELFFSGSLTDLIPNLFVFKAEQIEPNLVNWERDFSYKLELRRHLLNFCLYEDEMVEVSLSQGDQVLGTSEINSGYLSERPLKFDLEIPYLDFMTKIHRPHSLILTIKVIATKTLRSQVEQVITIDKVLQDCQQTFFRLMESGIFQQEAEYFTEAFKRCQIIPPLMTTAEVLTYLSRINISGFKHLDFFDWGELLLTFAIKGDFRVYKRGLRTQARHKIKLLRTGKPWPLSS